MKLKIRVLLLLIIGVIIGCDSSKKTEIELTKGIAIVEGKVSNYENSSKVISFTGNSILGDISQTAIIDSLGNFRTEIELLNPQAVLLQYDNDWAYLFLKPSDSLYLEFDLNSLINNKYEVSGSNPSTSKYIRDFYGFHGPYTFEPKYGDSISVKEYLNSLKQELKIEDSVLTEFCKQYNPSDEFTHWAKKSSKYKLANDLLLYYWHFDVNRKQLKPEIYDKILFPVDDDSAIVTEKYLVHLKNYLMAHYYRDPAINKFAEKKEISAATTYLFEKVIKNEKPGLSRDIMLYGFFLGLLENNFDGRDSLWGSYEPHLNNKLLVNILRKKKHALENREEINETTLDVISNSNSEIVKNFWETISTKHKDKIIYVDIWATWCGPCRSEVPHAIELHNYFEGKPVAFVNLCMASKKDDWKKFIAQNHIKGDNYFFNEDETKLLREELKFHGYPTYMIMDQKGNLINKNAPRPSSGDEIKSLLNKLL